MELRYGRTNEEYEKLSKEGVSESGAETARMAVAADNSNPAAFVPGQNEPSASDNQDWAIRCTKRWFVTVIADEQGQLWYNDKEVGFAQLERMLRDNPTPPRNTVLEVGYTDKAYRQLQTGNVAELVLKKWDTSLSVSSVRTTRGTAAGRFHFGLRIVLIFAWTGTSRSTSQMDGRC